MLLPTTLHSPCDNRFAIIVTQHQQQAAHEQSSDSESDSKGHDHTHADDTDNDTDDTDSPAVADLLARVAKLEAKKAALQNSNKQFHKALARRKRRVKELTQRIENMKASNSAKVAAAYEKGVADGMKSASQLHDDAGDKAQSKRAESSTELESLQGRLRETRMLSCVSMADFSDLKV